MITLNLFGWNLRFGRPDPFQFARDLQESADRMRGCLDKVEPMPSVEYNYRKYQVDDGSFIVECDECGDIFHTRKPNQRYCSRKCASRANGRHNAKHS